MNETLIQAESHHYVFHQTIHQYFNFFFHLDYTQFLSIFIVQFSYYSSWFVKHGWKCNQTFMIEFMFYSNY